jgi:hypothetical protein
VFDKSEREFVKSLRLAINLPYYNLALLRIKNNVAHSSAAEAAEGKSPISVEEDEEAGGACLYRTLEVTARAHKHTRTHIHIHLLPESLSRSLSRSLARALFLSLSL